MATATTNRSEGREKLLFTPGPLTTSRTVKEAMLRDLGSRDMAFIETVRLSGIGCWSSPASRSNAATKRF